MSEPAPTADPEAARRLAAGRLAARLRQLREDQRLIRRQIAPRLGCSPSLVEKFERAERVPNWQVIRRYEEVFAEAGDLQGLWAEVEAERQAERQARQQRTTAEGQGHTAPARPSVRVRWGRQPLRVTSDVTAVLGAADGMRRSLDVLLDDGAPGCGLLDRLLDQAEGYARDALTVAPLDMLDRLLLAMSDAQHLGVSGQIDSRRLRGVIARLAVLAAEEMTVLGRWAAARAWYTTAITAADGSTSDRLRADVRTLSGLLPLRSGHPSEAVRIVDRAADLAGRRSCLTAVMGPAIRAIGLAQLGCDRPARAYLQWARDAGARLDASLKTESLFAVAPRRLLLWQGQVMTALGDFDAAWRAHHQALALYPPDVVVDRVTICLDRATGLIGSGRIADGAELVAVTMIGIPSSHFGQWYQHAARGVLAGIPSRARHLSAVDACHCLLDEFDARTPPEPTHTNPLFDAPAGS